MKRILDYLVLAMFCIALAAPAALAKGQEKRDITTKAAPTMGAGKGQSGGKGGGGKPTTSTDYGDLYVILRDTDGVPILSPAGCLQPLDASGNLLLLDGECGILEVADNVPIEVDFGRLSVARSPDSVLQSSFDEVISLIKACRNVDFDVAGRLRLEVASTNPATGEEVVVQKVIDSPLENLALFSQVMKKGHLQTEVVIADEHGGEVTLRPALDPNTDYVKFGAKARFLLPTAAGSTLAEPLTNDDLTFASFFLAAAADKTGTITVDLVQYLNRILAIPNLTNSIPGNPSFVNFRGFTYSRNGNFNQETSVILPGNSTGTWFETKVNLLEWLQFCNGSQSAAGNIADFVQSANDALRVIEFIHNYEVPTALWPITVP